MKMIELLVMMMIINYVYVFYKQMNACVYTFDEIPEIIDEYQTFVDAVKMFVTERPIS